MLEATSEAGGAQDDPYFTRKQRSCGRGESKKTQDALKKREIWKPKAIIVAV